MQPGTIKKGDPLMPRKGTPLATKHPTDTCHPVGDVDFFAVHSYQDTQSSLSAMCRLRSITQSPMSTSLRLSSHPPPPFPTVCCFTQAMTAFRGTSGVGNGVSSGGSGGANGGAGEQEKRRRTAAMGKSGLQGYLTSTQDTLLRGFWQVRTASFFFVKKHTHTHTPQL